MIAENKTASSHKYIFHCTLSFNLTRTDKSIHLPFTRPYDDIVRYHGNFSSKSLVGILFYIYICNSSYVLLNTTFNKYFELIRIICKHSK